MAGFEDLITTTMENRSKVLADAVSKSRAIMVALTKAGNNKKFSGGRSIFEHIAHAENASVAYYSGAETIDVSLNQTMGNAEFPIRQAAGSVVITGLETLQNAGQEQVFDLIEERINVCENTLKNLITSGIYSDGTGAGGKQIGGLQALVADAPTSGTVGGINRATASNAFWRNQKFSGTNDGSAAVSNANIIDYMTRCFTAVVRGDDKPDLLIADNNYWRLYHQALVPIQRINMNEGGSMAGAGFPALEFMGAPVVLDGGYRGSCPENHMYFLNTKYIFFKTHSKRNFVVINGDRQAVNQDAIVKLLGWAGNMTINNPALQNVLIA